MLSELASFCLPSLSLLLLLLLLLYYLYYCCVINKLIDVQVDRISFLSISDKNNSEMPYAAQPRPGFPTREPTSQVCALQSYGIVILSSST